MATRNIRIRFDGDAAGLEKSTEGARSSLERLRTQADTTSGGINRISESTDNMDTKMSSATGALGALSSGFELVGLEQYATGLQSAAMATDFFSGVGEASTLVLQSKAAQLVKNTAQTVSNRVATTAHTVVTKASTAATVAQTAAQRVLNTVMRANPIGIVITVLAALVGAFVLAYNKSETFRRIVNAVFGAVSGAARAMGGAVSGALGGLRNAVSSAASWVGGQVDRIIGFFRGLPGRVRSGMSSIGSAISSPFRAGLNGLKRLWNSTVGRVSFRIPSWVPGIGNKGWSFPRMATGGVIQPGRSYLVGERGPEVVTAGMQSRVTPNGQLGGDTYVTVKIGDQELRGIVQTEVRKKDRRTKRAIRQGATRVGAYA